VATFLFGRISIWMVDTLNSATPDNMMPPESEKGTEAASSAPEARGAVFQPVTDGWALTRAQGGSVELVRNSMSALAIYHSSTLKVPVRLFAPLWNECAFA
jgi:hypothetical protein